MLQFEELECRDQVTSSHQRKVKFVESLNVRLANHSSQTVNSQFYREMNKIVMDLQSLLQPKGEYSERYQNIFYICSLFRLLFFFEIIISFNFIYYVRVCYTFNITF